MYNDEASRTVFMTIVARSPAESGAKGGEEKDSTEARRELGDYLEPS